MEMLPQAELQRLLRQAPGNRLSVLDVSAVLADCAAAHRKKDGLLSTNESGKYIS